jgi:hypothetical protein
VRIPETSRHFNKMFLINEYPNAYPVIFADPSVLLYDDIRLLARTLKYVNLSIEIIRNYGANNHFLGSCCNIINLEMRHFVIIMVCET